MALLLPAAALRRQRAAVVDKSAATATAHVEEGFVVRVEKELSEQQRATTNAMLKGCLVTTPLVNRVSPYRGSPRSCRLATSPNNSSTQDHLASPCVTPTKVVSDVSRRIKKKVSFCSPLNISYEVTPYAEIYGMSPEFFELDCAGNMFEHDASPQGDHSLPPDDRFSGTFCMDG
eukprot:TRINITY_DN29610_c0_g1_i1.p1 TRINITY_DN29610_c0_g1~~TRINITY_DN29610_c0_g1_i1.p1  ORF type:complete len:202 (+),score=27.06 TRINITY_DN29610_c0_g1_i1:84-608(+)